MATTSEGAAKPAPRSGGRFRRLRRSLARILTALFTVHLVLIGVFFAFQNRLIFPGQASQGRPEAVVRAAGPGTELVRLTTARGDQVVGLFGAALDSDGQLRADRATRPTVLYFYGNGMFLNAALDEYALFRRLGCNVFIPDYVGYGMSSGRPSEAGCYATADAAYAHLLARNDIDPERIVAAGWSLGGAVAIDLAARKSVAGLVVFSTFTSLAEAARAHYPFLPTSLLARHRFENLRKIGRVRVPILIGHGSGDRIIAHAMSKQLAQAAVGPMIHFAVEGADHNDFYEVGGPRVTEAMRRFLERLP